MNSFFLNPTDEINIIINPSEAFSPNSILTNILKLLINDVSSELTQLFNLSFSRGFFPLLLKTSKFIPVYKKDTKLQCLITGQYLYYQILAKYLKDLCTIAYTLF